MKLGTSKSPRAFRLSLQRFYKTPGRVDEIIASLHNAALSDWRAAIAIIEQLEGKPVQPVEHSGPGGLPIQAQITHLSREGRIRKLHELTERVRVLTPFAN